MYVDGPTPLYISYASPEQTRHYQYQETLKAAGDDIIIISLFTHFVKK